MLYMYAARWVLQGSRYTGKLRLDTPIDPTITHCFIMSPGGGRHIVSVSIAVRRPPSPFTVSAITLEGMLGYSCNFQES